MGTHLSYTHTHTHTHTLGGRGCGFTSFSTMKAISKTGLADGESRHLGMEDQDLPTIPPSHSILTPGRPVLALYPIVRRLTGSCYFTDFNVFGLTRPGFDLPHQERTPLPLGHLGGERERE